MLELIFLNVKIGTKLLEKKGNDRNKRESQFHLYATKSKTARVRFIKLIR